jgi:dTMP kinase
VSSAKFITVEGIEGVGKSTHIGALCDCLSDRGIDVHATREPGGTRLGEQIRGLLLGEAMHPDTELLLMFAARAQHLHQVVLPALASNRWVVCDRFTDASYAYQGGGRGIAVERIAIMEQWVQSDLRPHLTLLLDADVETALARIGPRQTKDRFERETIDFFIRARMTYLEMAAREPRRFRIIDANGLLDDVRRQIMTVCDSLMADY